MKKPVTPERAIHLGIVHALNLLAKPGMVWWHTANERRTSAREGAFLKKMGVKAGVPDFVILGPGLVAFLEVKRPGSYLSPSQRAMAQELESAGYSVTVVRSVDEAIDKLEMWGVINTKRVAA